MRGGPHRELRSAMTACHQVGDRVALHMSSCRTPDQHRRAIIRGTIYAVRESRSPKHPEVVATYYTVVLDTGGRAQLGEGDWSEAACPNAVPARWDQKCAS